MIGINVAPAGQTMLRAIRRNGFPGPAALRKKRMDEHAQDESCDLR
ncbi:hypothetical protein LB518_02910 [Mesorhizobium sp. BR1-1-16]|nr:hypothetical protein [Mesorhizobium sp. BR1-1-16]MBZ9935228.1 hypothetical protein [Mesorhizobium sp. BR1-1-16]